MVRLSTRRAGAVLALSLGILAWPMAAVAQVGADEAKARVAAEYGVEVLRVRAGEIDGAPVWLVTVMNRGGSFNEAFQVTTLAVDQASGALVPAFRHGPSGAAGTVDAVDTGTDARPDAMRSGTWR